MASRLNTTLYSSWKGKRCSASGSLLPDRMTQSRAVKNFLSGRRALAVESAPFLEEIRTRSAKTVESAPFLEEIRTRSAKTVAGVLDVDADVVVAARRSKVAATDHFFRDLLQGYSAPDPATRINLDNADAVPFTGWN